MSISWLIPHSDLPTKFLRAIRGLMGSSLCIWQWILTPEKRSNNHPRFLTSLTYKGKIRSHQIWKINCKYDDNYIFNLYGALILFKALFCPLSHVTISVVFISNERMECLLNLLLQPICNFWYHQFETTNGKTFSLFFPFQKSVSASISCELSLKSFFIASPRFCINVTRIFSFWAT